VRADHKHFMVFLGIRLRYHMIEADLAPTVSTKSTNHSLPRVGPLFLAPGLCFGSTVMTCLESARLNSAQVDWIVHQSARGILHGFPERKNAV
jgi:hypothetical protein